MITPPGTLTKKEQRALRKRILELGYDGLVKRFQHQGWSLETSKSLAESIMDETIRAADEKGDRNTT